ncbi:MaoC/PaaZ C-terminal domain-containing protein [Streptomyces ficellus]|uniref:MaoC/PaaZ C-terminal domain-containing protein n=1 Tax=Streptomyces ficellus TaxID=1977088 RepID=A0ABT7Z3L5_9ACTN|nr:MaoC/PaaZ C-terminal domain-containing protein [Streptomyces ficellus]MDN3294077.1 MaoC/PaaZ C-terminal domain-containing protein [Streptomyces ficellus]
MVTLQEIAEWYQERAGQHCGHSDWFEITQPDVNAFADVTRDWQDIHVDPGRAADGPYGTPVAHGFLVLSLVTYLTDSLLDLDWSASGLNQRLDRVRFRAPAEVGCRLRAGVGIVGARTRPRGFLELVLSISIEKEDGAVVCSAEQTRLYLARPDARLPRFPALTAPVPDARA